MKFSHFNATFYLICFLSLFFNEASSQISLPADFHCQSGELTNGNITFSCGKFYPSWKNKTSKALANLFNNDSEMCCGKYQVTKDGLVWGTGTFDMEGEGAGDFFYKVFSPMKGEWVCVRSRFNDANFKNWSTWLLRSVRGVSGNLQLLNQRNNPCR